MKEEDLQKAVAALQSQVAILGLDLMAARLALGVLYGQHHNREALLAAYHQMSEHATADTLTRTYPEPLVDHFRKQLDELEATLR